MTEVCRLKFSEGIEKMVMKRLEGGVENIDDEIIKQMIENSQGTL